MKKYIDGFLHMHVLLYITDEQTWPRWRGAHVQTTTLKDQASNLAQAYSFVNFTKQKIKWDVVTFHFSEATITKPNPQPHNAYAWVSDNQKKKYLGCQNISTTRHDTTMRPT